MDWNIVNGAPLEFDIVDDRSLQPSLHFAHHIAEAVARRGFLRRRV
jgi:hypothetical protein